MEEVTLGIDYGHVRIGIAKAEGTVLAYPFDTLEKSADPSGAVLALATAEKAKTLVVGLPRSLESEDTIQTAAARSFAASLTDKGFQVVLQDEAGTSSLAEEHLQASGKPYTKADIDAHAAAIILQDYLDNL